jgi:predicted ArsR family transcriptional regulator
VAKATTDRSQGAPDQAAEDFSAAVTALSSAFGDPTRRSIFLYLRDHPSSSVTELAEHFSLHPNVVRHHLDRLIAASHVVVEAPVRSKGVGRPAKRYSVADAELAMELGSRRDDLLVALLERALELLGPEQAEQMATEVGETYGRELASHMGGVDKQRTVSSAMAAVAETLTAHGFKARAEDSGSSSSVVAESCPFGEAAAHHPVLCAVDRGMVAGLLEGLGARGAASSVRLRSRARGDDDCRATA